MQLAYRVAFLAIAILGAPPAIAQQPAPPSALDRVSLTLGQCVGISEQRADEIGDLRKQLAIAQAAIKSLQDKAIPSKE